MLTKLKNFLLSENFIRFIFGLSISIGFVGGLFLTFVCLAPSVPFEYEVLITVLFAALIPLTCYLVFFKWLNFQGLKVHKAWFAIAAILALPAILSVAIFIHYYIRHLPQLSRELITLNAPVIAIIPQMLIYIGAYKKRILFYIALLLPAQPTIYAVYNFIKTIIIYWDRSEIIFTYNVLKAASKYWN